MPADERGRLAYDETSHRDGLEGVVGRTWSSADELLGQVLG